MQLCLRVRVRLFKLCHLGATPLELLETLSRRLRLRVRALCHLVKLLGQTGGTRLGLLRATQRCRRIILRGFGRRRCVRLLLLDLSHLGTQFLDLLETLTRRVSFSLRAPCHFSLRLLKLIEAIS